MSEIVVTVGETDAVNLLGTVLAGAGHQTVDGTAKLGPLDVRYRLDATLTGGGLHLNPPATVRITDLRVDYALSLSFEFDIGSVLPEEHIPRVCFDVPVIGRICTPAIHIDWPTIRIPVSVTDFVRGTAELSPAVTLDAEVWNVAVVVQGVPVLQLGPAANALFAAIGTAATAAVALVPGIGPFLAVVVAAITATISVAAATGLLGRLLQPLVAGRAFPIYRQPQRLEIVPALAIRLDQVTARVDDSSALVLAIGFSPL
ncbi:hypothetical protein [Actinoplanes regularis]|uniref:hypothetical protein n=1 Tax=Actinoplanes regularis TaxID=52697 RepID=UPI0024A34522|nr:hypothetical protein [Actinoplanes regularis]GLW29241.1 hypothetical protein Areg01_21810 [Actinoplanes regularis]